MDGWCIQEKAQKDNKAQAVYSSMNDSPESGVTTAISFDDEDNPEIEFMPDRLEWGKKREK